METWSRGSWPCYRALLTALDLSLGSLSGTLSSDTRRAKSDFSELPCHNCLAVDLCYKVVKSISIVLIFRYNLLNADEGSDTCGDWLQILRLFLKRRCRAPWARRHAPAAARTTTSWWRACRAGCPRVTPSRSLRSSCSPASTSSLATVADGLQVSIISFAYVYGVYGLRHTSKLKVDKKYYWHSVIELLVLFYT